MLTATTNARKIRLARCRRNNLNCVEVAPMPNPPQCLNLQTAPEIVRDKAKNTLLTRNEIGNIGTGRLGV